MRYDYPEYEQRVGRVGNELAAAGIERGDRIATCCWNHHRHFDIYFVASSLGIQFHTVNLLLPTVEIDYIVRNAEDRMLFLELSAVETFEEITDTGGELSSVERFVVMDDTVPDTSLEPIVDFDSFVAGHGHDYEWPHAPEEQPVDLCYTSGTTGRPKGVEYTRKMIWTHAMANINEQGHGIRESDTVLHAVPMFTSMRGRYRSRRPPPPPNTCFSANRPARPT